LGKEWQNSQKIVNSVFTDTLPDYTSRGPSTGNALLKPDITAPGQTIFTADAGTGTGGLPGNGTSSAAPHIAGAMALLRQIHPTWSVEELKALAMNTATHGLFTGPDSTPPRYAPSRVGAGRIDLGNAGASDVIAFCTDDPGAVSVSFGSVEVVGSLTRTKTVKVVNKGATAKTFSLGYDAITEVPGVNFSFPGVTSLTVPAGGAITFPVELSATASLMKHTHDPAVSETMAGLPRHWLSEKSGYIILASGSGPGLRLPVYAAARPASAMGTSENQIVMNAAAGAVNLTLSGQGVNTGTSYPLDEISLVSPLELQYISQNEASSAGAQNGADLKYIGVTSDYKVRAAKGQGVADTVIQFGLTTHGDWSSPNEHGYLLFVDSNRDGLDDYEVKLDYASGARDLFGIWAYPLPNGSGRFQFYLNGFSAAQYNTVPFNTNIMVLPVKASDIGLSETRTRFNYRVETYLGGQLIDKSDTLTYDVVRPGLHLLGDFLGPFAYYDTDGNAIPVQYNRDNYLANGSKGLLLLHHHNAGGSRAQLLAVIDGIGLETVSIPNRPSGPADGLAGTSYSYVTAGSVSSLGHTIEYQFDWKGDGTDLSSWGPPAQSKTWSAEGAYNVRVRARCSKDTSFISDWSAVLGVNITPIPPNLTPYKPSKWSDRIVVSTTKGAKTDSSSLATTDTLYVNWALINSGNGPTTVRFWTELYVDDEMRGRWYGDPPLKPGDSFSVVDYSIGSLKEGTHEIRIVIDPDDDQAESNDWDNDYMKTVTVSVAGPDLTGEWVSPPSQTCKGSGSSQKCKITGSLRVENIGNRDVVTTSYVEFYLEGEIEDTLMKRISVGKLKKGKSSIVKLSYSLPTGANAQGKYVLAMIDADDAVGEIDEDNNLIFYEEIP
jgi:hypothetical protein